ncbi:phosphatidate cytidylyltransferase [Paenibacillus gansuensis]|uniref:Phosphatidate cytidylyltransferase n=1 Tax=Paenibacillus gansuensis TaxID=306542 RepID=A0ABW5PEW3_9BACL
MKQRIVTGVLAGAAFLFLLVLGEVWFRALITVMSLIGFYEFAKMNGFKSMEIPVIAGYAAVLYLVMPASIIQDWHFPPMETIIWLFMLLLMAITVFSKNKKDIGKVSLLFIGVVYIGIGFHYMTATRDMDPNGLFFTFVLFVCIWASDSGAYFTGKAFGKNKLWPEISPNKTIEGSVGGIVISVLAAVLFAVVKPDLLNVTNAVWIGVVSSVFGQLGDLIQSAYKRVRGVKDSGNLLPGHGGILDRCDSWLIVFPLVHMLGLI